MVNAPLNHLKLFHAPWLEFAIEAGQMLLEWKGMSGKIDEDVAVPHSSGNCIQRIVGFAKALYFFHVRRAGQRSVKFVCPGVILALNTSGKPAFCLLAQHCAAMAANIVKSADVVLLVARDDHTGVGELAQEIIAGAGNLAGASGAEPHIKVDGFHFALEPSRISVITLRQRAGLRDRNFWASV